MATIVEVNAETGEVNERNLSQVEAAVIEQAQAQDEAAARAAADKAAAREAVLRKLGLADDDLSALGF